MHFKLSNTPPPVGEIPYNSIAYLKDKCHHGLPRAKALAMTEVGRSMVEMLGVLAVVGVISAGGLYGFNVAMKRHQANELMNEALKRAVMVASQIALGREPSDEANKSLIGEFTDPTDHEFKVKKANDKQFNMEISGVSEEVCEQMKNMAGNVIKDFEPETCSDDVTVKLTFNNDMGTTDSTGANSPTRDNSGATEDEAGAVCSGTRPGACSVCLKTYVDSTSGAWFDSDALCTEEGQTCVDGTCVTSAADEPTFTGPMCKCIYNTHEDEIVCGGDSKVFCSTDIDCRKFGKWDESAKECVVERFCTKNGDCTNDEYCHYTSLDSDTCRPNKKGTCVAKADTKGDFAKGTTAEANGFIRSATYMDWFTAQNFCRSYGKNLVTLSQMGLGDAVPSGKNSCKSYYGKTIGCQNLNADGWSAIQAKFGKDFDPWTANLVPDNSCVAFYVYLTENIAQVSNLERYYDNFLHALCK